VWAVAWCAVGAAIGWFGHAWVINLVRIRDRAVLEPRPPGWLTRATITAGSALPGTIGAASLPLTLKVTLFIAGVLTWWLACIDAVIHRLPDPLIGILAGVVVGGYSLTYLTNDMPVKTLLTAAIGGVVAMLGFLALALIRAGAMGFGDVKLAGVLGFATAWFGWQTLAHWVLLSFITAGLAAIILILARRVRAADSIAFGPWLVLGAAIAIVLSLVEGVTH